MKDPLLNIGTIVTVNEKEESQYMIIGKRIVNYHNLRAWDYISIPYPEGLTRQFKSDNSFAGDSFLYFNHYEITGVIKEITKE